MKIWQAVEYDGNKYTFLKHKPKLGYDKRRYESNGDKITDFLFSIPLKPLQIAEITTNEDGTWTYEIERKEGFYFVKNISSGMVLHLKYSKGSWFYPNGEEFLLSATRTYTISKNRIPDECLI